MSSVQDSSTTDPNELIDPDAPIYVNRACKLIHIRNPVRQLCIKICTSKPFDNFITFLIIANCVFLAIDGPTDLYDPNHLTTKQLAIYYAEYVFLVLFTMEMVLKIIAFGFCFGPNTYMKNQWNWLDFSVVVIGYMGFVEIPGFPNLSSLRTFRVLRPLKTLTTVPGMKVIVVSMISALPALSGVVLLTLGMFFVWSVIGLQLWGGIMESRCYYPPTRRYNIPLMKCTSLSIQNNAVVSCNSGLIEPLPSTNTWDCSEITTSDVFTDTATNQQFSFTELIQSHTFFLNRSTGLANIQIEKKANDEAASTSTSTQTSCRIPCTGSTKCGTNNNKYTYNNANTEIMLSLNQSLWETTGELIFGKDQWPVPRNLGK